ncbi:hypothetical protein [Zhongshania sp.]|uniref:hypothetical protein n=1 Tax=Zhongshania sp. TaxID=1971902 RepID=UPI003566A361
MASKIVNRGLQVIGGRASNTADAFAAIQSLAADDGTVAFAAAHTAINSGGAVTNQADVDFDATPTRAGQVITHVATFPTGSANFTIRRLSLHNAAAASVSASSTTLVSGIDGQSLTKTSDFSLEVTITITYADAS